MILDLLYDYFIDVDADISDILIDDLANYLENSGVVVLPCDDDTDVDIYDEKFHNK